MKKYQAEVDSARVLIAEASSRLGEALKKGDTTGIKAAHALLDSGNKTFAENLPKLTDVSNKIASSASRSGIKKLKK